jgi:hypothetical protein
MREIGTAARARQHLEALRVELTRCGLESELVTSGSWPRLRLRLPGTLGDVFDDNVVAAEEGGEWMFFWPWIQRIGTAADPAKAAQIILDELGVETGIPRRRRRVSARMPSAP